MKNIIKFTAVVFISIGSMGIIQSCKEYLSPPDLITFHISEVTPSSAVSSSRVRDDGGTEVTARGVCWSTSPNPTTNSGKTDDGKGSGPYLSVIDGLLPYTTYYVRAYAINSEGISYGNELAFTTTVPTSGIRKSDFPGELRTGSTIFTIGNKVYLGLGSITTIIEDGTEAQSLKDFWEWDQVTNQWTQKSDFPGNSGSGAVGFSIGTKGYVRTENAFSGVKNEFWEYDPATDNWTKKASLPVNASRIEAVGFSIGSKGYIGTGYLITTNSMENLNDFWEYDPATDEWAEKASLPASAARGDAVGFSIGNKGYIGTGSFTSGIGGEALRDFWEWDQETDTWTRKADVGPFSRAGAVGFSIGNKGYIGTGVARGENGNIISYSRDFWEWDQASNTWTRLADLEGDARADAVGVSVGDKGYVGAGIIDGDWGFFTNDFWEIDPAGFALRHD